MAQFVRARAAAFCCCLAAMLLLSASAASQANAELITVNTTLDTYVANGSSCSLREAITAASTDVPFAACPGGRGIDTIVLPAGTYVLTIPPTGANDNASGDLEITGTEDLTIDGAGASSTVIDAGGFGGIIDRILHISSAASVEIAGVEITGGLGIAGADGAPDSSDNGQPGAAGGGILDSGDGNLTITNSVIENNRSGTGGAGGSGTSGGGQGGNGGAGGAGGGVAKTGAGSLTITDTTFDSNGTGQGGAGGAGSADDDGGDGGTGGAGGDGGAVFSATASVSIMNTTISANGAGLGGDAGLGANGLEVINGNGGAGGNGGGVATGTALLEIDTSTLSANVAGPGAAGAPQGSIILAGNGGNGGSGGAIEAGGGSLDITNSTVTGNSGGLAGAAGAGMGGLPGNDGVGGGIDAAAGAGSTIVAGTIAANTAPSSAGSVNVRSGTLPVLGTIFSGTDADDSGCSGDTVDGGGNLNGGATGCPGASGEPGLGALEFNGGPTQTMLPAADGPAVNQIVPGSPACPATDERGFARPQGPRCDIGAVELTVAQASVSPLSLTFGAQPVFTLSQPLGTTLDVQGGELPLVVTNTTVTGSDPDDFLITTDSCLGSTLTDGESCALHLRFAPTATGARAATLELDSDTPGHTVVVPLAGNGTGVPAGPPGPPGPPGPAGPPGPPGPAGPARLVAVLTARHYEGRPRRRLAVGYVSTLPGRALLRIIRRGRTVLRHGQRARAGGNRLRVRVPARPGSYRIVLHVTAGDSRATARARLTVARGRR